MDITDTADTMGTMDDRDIKASTPIPNPNSTHAAKTTSLNTTNGSNSQRVAVANLIQKYGQPLSNVLLDSRSLFFSIPTIEGAIGYRLISGCAIVISDPVCPKVHWLTLIQAFDDYCKENKLKIIYLVVSEEFANWAMENFCKTLIEVGKEVSLDPTTDLTNGNKGATLRRKTNHSKKSGVIIEEYRGKDPIIEEAFNEVAKRWNNARRGPQMFLGEIALFNHSIKKRVFYAKKDEKYIGFLVLTPVDIRRGWVMNFVVSTPDAPVGINEHLTLATIEKLRDENCHFFSLGGSSGAKLGKIEGVSPIFKFFASLIFSLSKTFFHLDRRQKYLKKFSPKFKPTYVLFCGNKITIQELLALKQVFNISFYR